MTQNALVRIDPRSQRYFTDTPGIGGVIKVRPEDFIVDERPLYELSGTGEHLYLFVEKVNVSHGELVSVIQNHFNVSERAIGYAGMKDKIGVTRQLISVHVRGNEPSHELRHDRIRILWKDRHTNKLRRGHLAGNRFSIRIREINPMFVTTANTTLRQIDRHGVPNYFGYQRFGYRLTNHVLGACCLSGAWQAALDELLGTGAGMFPEHQRQQRELYDQERYDEAAQFWTRADRSELAAINALRRGADPHGAIMSVGQTAINFWISALQSAIFNRVLDERIDDGILGELIEGDLAWKHDNGAVFAVTKDDLTSPELPQRLQRIEISPSGPLWSRNMPRASGEVARRELEALRAVNLEPESFNEAPRAMRGTRRPLRVPISNTDISSGVDEHGNFIRLAFDLPRGSYATTVLREIMKNDVPDSQNVLPDSADASAES